MPGWLKVQDKGFLDMELYGCVWYTVYIIVNDRRKFRGTFTGYEGIQRNYKIYYVIEEDTIYIVRILHMLVDSKAWLYRTFGL